jgi:hypothetical protein
MGHHYIGHYKNYFLELRDAMIVLIYHNSTQINIQIGVFKIATIS